MRGVPPARTPHELARVLRAAGMPEKALKATALWLVSGRREPVHTRTAYIRDVGWWAGRCRVRGCDSLDRSPAYELAASVTPDRDS
ncbi:hypothetical protein [Spirillospora sp. CA-294931]|uniref:hypothetical protein n=1 Tax=Spirillospora sp. CA-294931 TaxID=3240042 RepID=UPI003D90498B